MRSSVYRKLVYLPILLCCCISLPASAVKDALESYQEFSQRQQVKKNSLQFDVSSSKQGDFFVATTQAVLQELHFDEFSTALVKLSNWCAFAPLHLNVKACAYEMRKEPPKLRLYLGTKGFQQYQEAYLLAFDFDVEKTVDQLTVKLFAKEGPFGTSDYRLTLRAIPVPEGVFVRWDLSQRLGILSSLSNLYLNTLWRHKIGFTQTGTDWLGRTKYVRGLQAASERNVVRYLLALNVYFATRSLPIDQRFEIRISRWFDETEEYHDQLYEIDKPVYISAKRRERQNQLLLQSALDKGLSEPKSASRQRNR